MKRRKVTASERDAILADVRALIEKHKVSVYTIIGFLKLAGKAGMSPAAYTECSTNLPPTFVASGVACPPTRGA